MTKTINNLIDKKLDKAIEDKFLMDSDYIENAGGWSEARHNGLLNVSPAIERGENSHNRIGDRVHLKYLAIEFLVKGFIANTLYPDNNGVSN